MPFSCPTYSVALYRQNRVSPVARGEWHAVDFGPEGGNECIVVARSMDWCSWIRADPWLLEDTLMNETTPRLIDVDWAAFKPWKVTPVRHRISDHPKLQLDSLVELSTRLAKRGGIRSHSNDAYAGTAFNNAPKLYPNQLSPEETLTNIASAKAWMSLLNVQSDDIYRGLVDEVLDDLKPRIDRVDPGMTYRGGWIFVTSPNTVTPFHMDKEHNFILQIKGHKRLYVWEPDDIVAVSEEARDLFHATHSRDLVAWREELRSRAHVFDLEPGMGAYMPSTAPHLVENGDGPSVTVSFTYYTDATRRNSRLHALHQRMRRRRWTPDAVGTHPMLDSLADGTWQAFDFLRGIAGTPGADTARSDRLPYALANMS